MKKFLRRFFFKTFTYVGIPLLLLGGLYGWWAKSRLDGAVGAEWTLHQLATVPLDQSAIKSSLPRVLRVAVKRKDGANYRPHGNGTIADVFDWNPASSTWSSTPMSLEEQAESLRLRAFSFLLPGELIEILGDQNQRYREVAFALLRARTDQDFGYRHDLPPDSQRPAIDKWRAWWDKNKLTWSVEKGLEAIRKPGKDASAR